jgi:predicted transcriptional regulator
MTEPLHKKVSLHVVRDYNRRLQGHMRLIAVQAGSDIGAAINQMQIYGISQLPVLDGARVVGSLDERALLERLVTTDAHLRGAVEQFMQPPLPALDEAATLDEALGLLRGGAPGVLVTQAGAPVGILTAADLIAFKVYGGHLEYEI